MSKEIQIFNNDEFGQVRTLVINGEPYFVGKDVAKILGYTTLQRMYDHVEKEDKKKIDPQSTEFTGLCENGTTLENNPNVRTLVIINESGLYDAIFGSKLPNAKKFKRWVTSEVLPQIRKTGSYQIPKMSKELQAIFMIDGKTEELKNEINGVKKDLEDFKDNAPLFNSECDELMDRVKSVATKILGYKTPAYNDKSLRGRVYSDMQHQLRREFGVKKYKAIKRCQLSKAFEIVNNYVAPTVLIDEITRVNNQVSFEEAM
ncbi:ORF6C domain-containing protein [Clostridium neonatale]|uniref:BRO domain protein n=2 Tax=Clostridium TaxID=1485 RepID=A0AA86MMD7_9CLOT|nr:ORF6C domain-containing protein [Clostridium neonatale]CAG9703682.1 BRO domain protein [Clostridium neonatale]CAI3539183.1 BRO domain protein [Clostridium neonatale]CAI3540076.1 BRO domain protein [Clostridium neonatale]CAI3545682.1 BRO domain protein [Clostridium neonatale]CAI3552363.1 BRO domain protein [Clostridium neonatale]